MGAGSNESGGDVAGLPTGDVTFLFTDVEGSTRLLAELGGDYASALGDQRRIVRECVAAADGHVVDSTGDAFLLVFSEPTDAVTAAAAIQHRVAGHRWPQERQLRVRMGIHSGTPVLTDEGYVGLDVHLGARVCAAAHGGQVLVTAQTRRRLAEIGAPPPAVSDLGVHLLKDIAAPVELHQLHLGEGLRTDFPPLRTLDNRPTNLPHPVTALLGREAEVAEISTLLREGPARLVTLTGPGGSGKTRLALEVAGRLVNDFPDGVFLAAIAPITDPKLVIPTIAQTIGVHEGPGRTREAALREFLAERRLLLVLDNLEQVTGAGPDVAGLVARCAGLRVLATSREALHVSGELRYPVAPLPVPDAADLFAERARAFDPASPVADRADVEELCRRLDGLPLAVELAAAWHGVLTPAGILDRLEDRFALLSGGPRDLPERQQTLRRTIDWSYDLLTEPEQRLFTRLAVFADGWTLEAAQHVCAVDRRRDLSVLDGVRALIAKNLVHRTEGVDGEPRYAMLETIREYGAERLAEDELKDAVRDAHADYYAELCWRVRDVLSTVEGRGWVLRLQQEQANLRVALDRLVTTGSRAAALRLVSGAWRSWLRSGNLSEGERLSQRVVDAFPDDGRDGLAANAAIILGEFHRALGAAARSRDVKAAALPTLLEHDLPSAAYTLADLGVLALREGRFDEAVQLLEESLGLGRALSDPLMIGHARCGLGLLRLTVEDLDAAAGCFQDELDAGRELQEDEFVSHGLIGMGWVALGRGRAEEAQSLFTDSLQVCLSMNDVPTSLDAMAGIAAAMTAGQAAVGAIQLLAVLDRWCTTTGTVLWFPDRRAAQLAALRHLVEPTVFEKAWTAGRSMSLAHAAMHAVQVAVPSS